MAIKNLTTRAVSILLVALMFTMPVSAQSVDANVSKFIDEQIKLHHIPGMQVVVVQYGKIVYSKSFGIANIENAVPVTSQTLFPVHSITKAFVGVAIMQLIEAGKINLDAPVSRYLDSLPSPWEPVTIRQLLTHTSGLPDIWDGNSTAIDIDADYAWQKVLKAPLNGQPLEKFQYVQTNYILLGKVITKLSGMPFTEFIRQRQFKPSGMTTSGFGDAHNIVPHLSGSYTYRHIVNHQVEVSDTLQNAILDWPPYLWTAVGLNTTADELAKWTIKLQDGTLLNKKSLLTLWAPGILKDGTHHGFSPILDGYALGWPVSSRPMHPVAGPTGGGRAAFFIYRNDDLTVIVLTNMIFSAPQSYIDGIASFYIKGLK
ncbi:serine hydrolase domain-containing protein [Mucilaginibacter sp. UYCu711]|uniref:serine hydrolase domain-containing protein n=1 Tax=Mucilaginibacter sp. UYCu711 TaxID=3156339 RepID=UPI003D1A01C8